MNQVWPNKFIILIKIFAAFWIIDGLLQFQPNLLSSKFINHLIKPLFVGDNHFILSLSNFFNHLFLLNSVFFGLLIGLIQIAIGILIWKPSFQKIGLRISIFWSAFIWVFGQNFGGLINHQFNYLTGAPGPALIYLILSCIFLLFLNNKKVKALALANFAWLFFWLGQIISLFIFNDSIRMTLKMRSYQNLPIKLSLIDHTFYNFTYLQTNFVFLIILIFSLLFAFSIFFKPLLKKTLTYLAFLYLFIIFLFFQNFGAYSSGLMTDVGLLPLMILLGIIITDVRKFEINRLINFEKFLT